MIQENRLRRWPKGKMAQAGESRAPALVRGLDILELLAEKPEGLNFTELKRYLNIPKPSLSRILKVLLVRGYIRQIRATRKYVLGFRLITIGSAILERLDLRTQARPIMQELVEKVKATVELGILDEGELLYIEKLESPDSVRLFARVGSRYPSLHASALGKVLLAYMSVDELKGFFKKGRLTRVTKNTATNIKRLRGELAEIRSQGFAFDDQETRIGIRRVAAPILNHQGELAGALGIAGPIFRIEVKDKERLGRLVKKAAGEISVRMGYHDSSCGYRSRKSKMCSRS